LNFVDIAKSGSKEDWSKHLEEGNDPNEFDTYGTTPLSWVVKLDEYELFSFAIENGADPFFPYRNGGALVFDLLSQNKAKFLQLFLEKKDLWKSSPNLRSRDKDGNTIFHKMIEFGDEDLWFEISNLINENDWELRNEEGRTLLLEAVATGNLSFVTQALDTFPNLINQKDKTGKNVLHIAAEQNLSEDVEFLIGIGLSLEEKDQYGNTALFLAASGDSVESMQILLDAGADLLVFGENYESITRLIDREKYSHSMKLWKKELYKRLKGMDLNKENPEFLRYLTYLKAEKPLLPAEIAQAKLLDFF